MEQRLDEWRRYFKDLTKLYEHEARIQELYFRDLSVHEFVEHRKGRKRLMADTLPNLPYYSKEFFEHATTKDIDEAIEDITESAKKNDGRYQFYSMQDGRIREDFHYTRDKEPLIPRPNQQDAIEKSIKAVDDELVKATNEVLEAEKMLEKAQEKVKNLTKQRSKLNNALNALN